MAPPAPRAASSKGTNPTTLNLGRRSRVLAHRPRQRGWPDGTGHPPPGQTPLPLPTPFAASARSMKGRCRSAASPAQRTAHPGRRRRCDCRFASARWAARATRREVKENWPFFPRGRDQPERCLLPRFRFWQDGSPSPRAKKVTKRRKSAGRKKAKLARRKYACPPPRRRIGSGHARAGGADQWDCRRLYAAEAGHVHRPCRCPPGPIL